MRRKMPSITTPFFKEQMYTFSLLTMTTTRSGYWRLALTMVGGICACRIRRFRPPTAFHSMAFSAGPEQHIVKQEYATVSYR